MDSFFWNSISVLCVILAIAIFARVFIDMVRELIALCRDDDFVSGSRYDDDWVLDYRRNDDYFVDDIDSDIDETAGTHK